MRSASANYNTYNALLNKSPVVAIEFDSANDKWVSGDFADIGSPPGSVVYHKDIIEIRASWPEIKTYNTNFQAATFTVDINDVSGAFTQFLNSGLPQSATLKLGFQEIEYDDFVNITESTLSVITVSASSIAAWKLELRDSIFGIANIFVKYRGRKITLANNYTDVWTTGFQTVLGDGSTTASQYFDEFADYTNNADQLVKPVLKVGNELVTYDTITTDTFETLTRGVGVSIGEDHAADSEVLVGILFECDPLRALLHLLTSNYGATNGKYDIGDVNNLQYHGISVDYVDVAGIEQLGWKMFQQFDYGNNGTCLIESDLAEVSLLDVLEERILTPFGLYFYSNNGKISVASNDLMFNIETYTADGTLTDDEINYMSRLDLSDDVIYSDLNLDGIQHGYNAANLQFEGDKIKLSFNSVESEGYYYNLRQAFEGVHYSGYGSGISLTREQLENIMSHRFMGLFNAASVIMLRCLWKTALFEIGDSINITWDKIPNLNTGTRGWSSAKSLIVGQSLTISQSTAIIEHIMRVTNIPGYWTPYAVDKIAEGSITDKTLSVSADGTATTEAVDAYYDNSVTTHGADRITFIIRLTEPNYGSGSTFETIELQFSWLTVTPAIGDSDIRSYINFNPQGSAVHTLYFDLFVTELTPATPNRVKVDWLSTTATGSEVPTVEFIGVWFAVNS